jgi:hypothetical protein
MGNESVYLTADSIRWASKQLQTVPENQLLLVFILVLISQPDIQRTSASKNPFVVELEKYIGGPLKGGGTGIFNPFSWEWRAEDYLQSTVFGRLLNGSHSWTNSASGYISRNPEREWPANFVFDRKGLDRLKKRSTPPCLKAGSRLPLSAIAIWYYKFDELKPNQANSIEALRETFIAKLNLENPLAVSFFEDEDNVFWGDLVSHLPLNDDEKIALFPASTYLAEPRKKVSIFEDDLKTLKMMQQPYEDISDVIRRLIMERK